ncbi:hypothetical protein K2Y11_00940 [bacterium]|nr:hypothetical protein [bacterium]
MFISTSSSSLRTSASCAIILSLMVGASTSEAAVMYSVRSTAKTQTSGNISNGDFHSVDTGVVQAASNSANPPSATSSGTFYSFSASADNFTEVGKIHGSVLASASSSGPAGGANADVQGFWTDTVTITSSTLANGTPVSFLATIVLHSTITGSQPGTHAYAYLNGPFGLNVTNDVSSPHYELTASTVVSTTVGSTLNLSSSLTLHADAGGIAPFNLSASVLAENTAYFKFDAITPGASYSAASGAVYVPEASSSVMMLSALVFASLGMRIRRR